jgi:hypothetical protein
MMSLVLLEIACVFCEVQVETEEAVDNRKYLMRQTVFPVRYDLKHKKIIVDLSITLYCDKT